MTRIHLIYPHNAARISTPDAIGVELGRRLAQRHEVIYYDWDAPQTIRPEPGDVLLGHAHPIPFTIFRNSMKQPGWRRVLLMAPYAHSDLRYIAFLRHVVPHCDAFLAITGRYWFQRVAQTPCAHWLPRMIHLDLAVNRDHFPPMKHAFNPPGERRFVYIGNDHVPKNIPYLDKIARYQPIDWIGNGSNRYSHLRRLGFLNFKEEAARQRIADYDFLITVGSSDANPTTILEAMAWGLIPVCTPQSGYEGYKGIINVPLNDVEGAVAVLRYLQQVDESQLREWQAINWNLLDSHFNWDRFARQVEESIHTHVCRPEIQPMSLSQRLQMTAHEIAAYRRPRQLKLAARQIVRRLRK
ncbi:MAG: glycosyltransferase [Anaerolineae bacterium]|nr:glycosyltransferase [Anaerolineae bacterium]MDW8172013.1 glycosyltransferase [Anaerolineae bacterium]